MMLCMMENYTIWCQGKIPFEGTQAEGPNSLL